ncbi:MAG: ribonuclease D [Gammaproteobacteria bacterium]|nr:ribonuclease D [Gammaproteobacteria bacterium]
MQYLFIETDDQLASFCQQLASESYCAVDTEFVREKTYYPLLSLIQISGEQHMACIDPFAITDFEPLRQLFQKPELLKVFHSPSQDLEILYQHFGEVPTPVFDTQLAAAVLGYQHQISYADLVFEVTGTRLEKKYTRADWSKRPLSKDEIDYAMDDVRYLMPVYRQIKQDLEAKNRTSWIEKDLDTMSLSSTYEVDVSSQWHRLKGIQKLKGVQLQIARKLCEWRELRAQQKNRPRRWIVADDWIIEIARKKPTKLEDLALIRDIPAKVAEHQGPALIDIVNQSLQSSASEWPETLKPQQLSLHQQALGDCLMGLCRIIADDNNIALATFATRKDIDNLITNRKSSRLAQGWRFSMAGEQLLSFIYGQSTLAVDDGRICLSGKSGATEPESSKIAAH